MTEARRSSQAGKRKGVRPCQYHCAEQTGGCGRHFASLRAYDLHRAGSFEDGTRRCVDPTTVRDGAGELRLVPKPGASVCGLGNVPNLNSVVWAERASLEHARSLFRSAA